MTNRFSFGVLSMAFLLCLFVVFQSLLLSTLEFDNVAESDFNLIFKFGVKGPHPEPRNRLDTIRGTFTQDMVVVPPITVKLRLPEEDMDRIRQKMIEIGFFQYPRRFTVHLPTGGHVGEVTPYSSYYFKVFSHGIVVKELWWDDKIWSEDERAENLRELIRLIIEFIKSTPEYKRMPQPRAGYV